MLDPVSVALKFGFLLVLYLFLLWVVRSGLKDLRQTSREALAADPVAPPADATGMHQASAGLGVEGEGDPHLVVERAPGHEAGMIYDVGDGATLGRGNVEIHLEDPFASANHARISREGSIVVVEDLGSTNGTYLNGEPLNGPQPLHPGDKIRIGDSEFTYAR